MRKKGQCPVCFNDCAGYKNHIEIVDGIRRLKCAQCECIFFDKNNYKKPVYDLKYNMEFYRGSDIKKAGIMAARLAYLLGPPESGKRILEIGSGNGLIPYLMNSMGYAMEDIEIDPEHADFLRRFRYIHVLAGYFEGYTSEYPYDMIYASHVIEHCPEPHSFIIAVQRNLKSGGSLYLDTPEVSFSKDRGKDWKHFRTRNPLEHCVLYRRETLIDLAKDYGLKYVFSEMFPDYESIQIEFRKE